MNEYDGYTRIVPDTSIIIQGNLLEILENENIDYPEIIITEASIAELEHQANKDENKGFIGLKNLKHLQDLSKDGSINLQIEGKRPNTYEIKNARKGEIDNLIRETAKTEDALLITSDKVQAQTAKAQGIEVKYIKPDYTDKKLKIEKFFTKNTMSVHLKENVVPYAKKGLPGNIKLKKLSNTPITYDEITEYIKDILDKSASDKRTYLEADLDGAKVIQSKDLRISINKPPFSEAIEITAVRPVADVSIEDYNLSKDLLKKITKGDHGILISGSPGAGKSTFAQALATHFLKENKIVKTMESPRDLQLPDEITQYSPLEGEMEKTADILLLVRPDVTIYDEVRKTNDFQIFADMRLAGVGMVGVVHATKPIDAIQRIANRVELGIIPSIVDTTIFIDNGKIENIYQTHMTVKVPTGMKEQDLARPVIEVRDYTTGDLMNEIYTYGEQTIVMDVNQVQHNTENTKTPIEEIAEKQIKRELKKYLPGVKIQVETISLDRVKVSIPKKYRPKIIGRGGKKIDEIEKHIGIHITLDSKEENTPQIIEVKPQITKKGLNIYFPKETVGESFDIIANNNFLFTVTVGKGGIIKLRHDLDLTDQLIQYINQNKTIYAEKRN